MIEHLDVMQAAVHREGEPYSLRMLEYEVPIFDHFIVRVYLSVYPPQWVLYCPENEKKIDIIMSFVMKRKRPR